MTTFDTPPPAAETPTGLRHVFYPYADTDQYLQGIAAYAELALAEGASLLVCAPQERSRVLRGALPADSAVTFLDTTALDRHPTLLIAAWQEWIGQRAHEGRAVCGLSEPCWAGRGAEQLSEMRYGEWLLNLAFAQAPTWTLLCPFDTADQSALDVLTMARCHPLEWDGAGFVKASDYVDGPFDLEPLPEAASPVAELAYSIAELAQLRHLVAARATDLAISADRVRDFTIAVSEVASNSILHGGGRGVLRMWVGDRSLVCELNDAGYISDPLAGKIRPTGEQYGGRGLWFAHQLCDLVQIRSTRKDGTRIRLHLDLVHG